MKKFTILAGLMTLALFIGVAGNSLRAGTAEARPTDVISFNPDVCAAVVVADLLDAGEDVADSTAEAADLCYLGAGGLTVPANLNSLAEILGGSDVTEAEDATLEGAVDDPATYGVLVDYSAAQLGSEGTTLPGEQQMWVLTMVTNDDPVHLDADEGLWLSTGFTSSQSLAGDCPFGDNDCDDDGVKGDGVVVDFLAGESVADLGDAIITATQSGIDVEMDYTVVGPPDDLTLTATKATIQEGAADEDCALGDFTTAIGKPQITGLLAAVTDEDGTALTGIQVAWDSSDEDDLHFALVQEPSDDAGDETTQTVSLSSGGQVSAPNLGCAGDPGTVTVNAAALEWALDADPDTVGNQPDFVLTNIDDETDITVVGAPASMTLAANPPSITCNGVNSSEVSATLLDSAGKPVVAGNSVRFEVVALGIATPIIAKTDANGVAKSTITPLSGVTAGVTVLVMVVDDDTIEGNILVACQPAVPVVVPPVTPPSVTPPRTGDGGYLP
jgi:hypothetical protein